MKNNYSLSIAIPTYNSSKYLASCISSVINFKVVDEIVVHDDNSDELEFKKIKKIIDKYVDKINIKLSPLCNQKDLYKSAIKIKKEDKI